jgi:hypothetical protein
MAPAYNERIGIFRKIGTVPGQANSLMIYVVYVVYLVDVVQVPAGHSIPFSYDYKTLHSAAIYLFFASLASLAYKVRALSGT